MRRTARLTVILALMAAFSSPSANAQASADLSFSAGPLFTGVSFGIYGPVHATSSVFYGASYGETYGPDYGVYGSPNSYGSCWDAYYMYYDHCVVQTSYAPVYYSYGGWAQSWYRNGGYYSPGYYQPSYYAYVSDPWGPRWGPFWAYDPWDSYWNGYWDGSYASSWYGGRSSYAAPYHVTAYYPNSATYYAGNAQYKDSPGAVTTGRTAQRRTSTASPTAPSRTAVAAEAKARPRGTTSVNRRAPTLDGPTGGARSGSGARSATAGAGSARSGGRTAVSGTGTTTGDRAVRTPTVGRKPISVARTTRGGPASRPSAGLPRRVPTSDGEARKASGERGSTSTTTGARTGVSTTRGTRGRSRPSLNRRPPSPQSGQAARSGSSTTRTGAAARTPPGRKQASPLVGTSRNRPSRAGVKPSRTPSSTRSTPGSTRATPSRSAGAQSAPARGSRARQTPSRPPTRVRAVPARGARSAPPRAAPRSGGNARSAPSRAPAAGRSGGSPAARSAPSRPASTPRAAPRRGSRPTGSAARGSTRRRNND